MNLTITPDVGELSRRLAEFIRKDIETVLASKDRYTFVLSGGSTPKSLYQLLAAAPYKDSIPWEKVHFFWGDERFVPFEDTRNNARMAYDELLSKVPVNPDHVHIMRTDLQPGEASARYTELLKSYFPDGSETFDLVLLGMGDDGHTLSLFPGTDIIHEKDKWVDTFYLDAQEMYRISLTAPIVNRARKVAFLAAGKNKAGVLYQVLKGETNLDKYPSQVIRPDGELYWFVDAEAASELD